MKALANKLAAKVNMMAANTINAITLNKLMST